MFQRTRLLAVSAGLVAASALVLAGFAPAPAPAAPGGDAPARTCFKVRDVNSVTVASPIGAEKADGVNLRLNNRDAYQLKALTSCPQLQDSTRIGIEAVHGTEICSGPQAKLVMRGKITGAAICQVDTLHKLSAEEVAAMPANERP